MGLKKPIPFHNNRLPLQQGPIPSLYREDLVEAAAIALLGGELRGHERLYQLSGNLVADDTRAQTQDVHVVVLYTLSGRVGVVADTRSDSKDLGLGRFYVAFRHSLPGCSLCPHSLRPRLMFPSCCGSNWPFFRLRSCRPVKVILSRFSLLHGGPLLPDYPFTLLRPGHGRQGQPWYNHRIRAILPHFFRAYERCMPSPTDPQLAAAELRRAAKLGLRGGELAVSTAVVTALDRAWDDLWAASDECGMPISSTPRGFS